MKQTRISVQSFRPWHLAAQGCSVLLLSLAIPLTATAKRGGGGGGGDGGGEVTVNPVPDLVAAPIGYTKTELVWKGDIDGNGIADRLEDTFRGVAFYGINNQGVVSSYINGPHPTDPLLLGRRIGGINIDPRAVGFKNVIIRPRIMGNLMWARTVYPGPYGDILCGWRKPYEDVIQLDVKIPANSTAEIHLPTLDSKSTEIMVLDGHIFKTVFENGKPTQQMPAIEFSRVEDDAIVYTSGAGEFSFTVLLKRTK